MASTTERRNRDHLTRRLAAQHPREAHHPHDGQERDEEEEKKPNSSSSNFGVTFKTV
jgi:hypothetical protein